MSVNRYRLRHSAKLGSKSAQLTEKLLRKPERIIGLILIGNNLVNIAAATLTTWISIRLGGVYVALGPVLLLIVVLLFSEVAPKTLAALKPEQLALPSSYVYYPLLAVTYPVVWLVNAFASLILRLIGTLPEDQRNYNLSLSELRTVVAEAGALLPARRQQMLMGILDLESVSVDDIMVPKNEIDAIDIEDPMDEILKQLRNSQHTRIPVYRTQLDEVIGILHLRKLLQDWSERDIDHAKVIELLEEPYFVPENTPLNRQLLSFQRQKKRIGLVVDEYGDIQGLATLDDILEEIVGEFTTDPADSHPDVLPQTDGSLWIKGSAHIRELNRTLEWNLPTNGPKTLSGLIVEHLERIPETGTRLEVSGHTMEVIKVSDSAIKTVKAQK